MCVGDKFKDKIDVPFWEKVHQEYMAGVKVADLESKYGYLWHQVYYYFSKFGLPKREKKQKPIRGVNKDLLKSLWEKGQSKCRHCNEIKSINVFTPEHGKLKDGTKVTRYYQCHDCHKEICRQKTGYYTKERIKTALEAGYKQCPKCKETKDIEYFGLCQARGYTKVNSHCKECRRIASLTSNMSQDAVERKRERDRIRAKSGENIDNRIQAAKKYRESEKGKAYFNELAKKQREDKLFQMVGAKCDVIHVNCKKCNIKQIKKLDITKGDGYTTICTKCLASGARGKNKVKEVPCYKCGLMHIAKSYKSQCSGCKAESNREHNREARKKRKGKPKHTQYRKRARIYGVKYEPVNKIKVFERDEYKCYLCGIDVVISEKYRPDQATIDHVIAMTNGGEHTYSNVKTCCHACNSYKGHR